MRDMVEIGMGRTARRTYELGDINIVPSRRTRSSQDVSTAWQLDAYRFDDLELLYDIAAPVPLGEAA